MNNILQYKHPTLGWTADLIKGNGQYALTDNEGSTNAVVDSEDIVKGFGFEPLEQEGETNDWIGELWKELSGCTSIDNLSEEDLRESILKHMPKKTIEDGTDTSVEKLKERGEIKYNEGFVAHARLAKERGWLREETGGASREVDETLVKRLYKAFCSAGGVTEESIANVLRDYLPTATAKGCNDSDVVSTTNAELAKNIWIALQNDKTGLPEKVIGDLLPKVESIDELDMRDDNIQAYTDRILDCFRNNIIEDLDTTTKDQVLKIVTEMVPHTTLSTPTKELDIEDLITKIGHIVHDNNTFEWYSEYRERLRSILSRYTAPDRDAIIDECRKAITKQTYGIFDNQFIAGVAMCHKALEQLKKPLSTQEKSYGSNPFPPRVK